MGGGKCDVVGVYIVRMRVQFLGSACSYLNLGIALVDISIKHLVLSLFITIIPFSI